MNLLVIILSDCKPFIQISVFMDVQGTMTIMYQIRKGIEKAI